MEQKISLTNGVRVLIERLEHVHSAAIGFWIDTGSEQEGAETNGICHFIEHMLFKGTERRTALDIAQSLEAAGGNLNAFTDKEHTCFHARVLAEEVGLAIDVLSDMLLNSRIDAKEVKREREVIVEEIKMYDDTPDDLVHELLSAAMWRDHPLGRPVTGSKATVRSFDRETLTGFLRDFYTPDRLVVALVGKVDVEAVTAQLEKAFAGFSQPGRPVERPALAHQAVTKVKYRDIEQVHLAMGLPGVSLVDERRFALALLNSILGGGMSSRLFQEVREKRGLVYSISSYESLYRPGGMFAISAGMSPKHLPTVLKLVHEELAKVGAGDIGEKELQDAKRQLRGGLLLSLEVPRHRMSRMAQNELYYGRHISPEEILAAIDRVTPRDLQQLGAELFPPDRVAMSVVGPIRKLPKSTW
ncbi:MAG: putative Zn-dependent peptidase [Cyanobacteria bacterium RYN_339]|nr:putative Zn-dependent peptidase [Cyanobacteria bacterium RYN_339]